MKIENRQQLLVVLALAVVGLFLADRVLFSPLTKLWKARTARIADLRVRVADGRELLKSERQIRERWEDIRVNALPNSASLAEQRLYEALDFWAQNSRVSVNSLTPQWKQDADDYRTLEFRVDASGDMRSLTRFLYDLEKDSMALRLQTVELSARDPNGQVMGLGLHVSGLVLIPEAQRVKR